MIAQTSVRAPMGLLLLGLLAGLILARHWMVSTEWLLASALVGSLITVLLARSKRFKALWLFAFALSSILCFWAYGNLRLAPEPTASDLAMPLREARITLKIKTVLRSNERYGIVNVIAQVKTAPSVGRLRSGELIYARLKLPEQTDLTKPSVTGRQIQKGLLIEATGVLTPITQPQNTEQENGFDGYLKSIGVHYRFDRVNELRIVDAPPAFSRFCDAMNHRFQEILRRGAPENSELANIYITMLLGDNATLTAEQNERYRITGTMHFFAISGLHIGVIAAVIAQFLLLLRIPQHWRPWFGLPLLYLYVEITGASPSAMRAFLMAAFFWCSYAFYRQRASFAALLNSAVLVLLVDPNQLWHLGFQLSYIVVGSILLLGLPAGQLLKQSFRIYQWLPKEDWNFYQRSVSRLLEAVLSLIAISFSAWLASMPLCAAFFNFIAPGAVLLNMLLVYLVAIVIITGTLSIGCAILPMLPASAFINHAAWFVISAMDGIVRLGVLFPNITLAKSADLPGLSYSILLLFFSSLFWLHREPGKRTLWHFSLPVVILLGGMGIILLLSES